MRSCSNCYAIYPTPFTHCLQDGSPLQEEEDFLLGRVLADRYRILSILGTGGMGRVYLAEHVKMGKRFAIKILFGHFAASEMGIARFRREAQTASRLNHLNIINVADFGVTSSGLSFLVMNLLAGRSLTTLITEDGPLSVSRTIRIGKQIALALAHAHDNGILHRDLSPGNVNIEQREEAPDFVTVLDFGLAGLMSIENPGRKLTLHGTIVGTPEFMSPEQAQGLELKPTSDLYSFGLLLYAMLSKTLPFPNSKDRTQTLVYRTSTEPRPLSRVAQVPLVLEKIVMKLLAKNPAERFETGRDVVAALEGCFSNPSTKRPLTKLLIRPKNTEDTPVEPSIADTFKMPIVNIDSTDLSAEPADDTNQEMPSLPAVLLEEAVFSASDLNATVKPDHSDKAGIIFFRGRFVPLDEFEPGEFEMTYPSLPLVQMPDPYADSFPEQGIFSSSDLAAVPPHIQQHLKNKIPHEKRQYSPPEEETSFHIGDYGITEKIKSGPSPIYRAVHNKTQKEVAIKILHTETPSPDVLWRLFKDARATSQIRHPNLVEIFDTGMMSDGKTAFIIMELLDGVNLEQYVQSKQALSLQEIRDIFIQICSGLVAGHNAGVIHRDLTPEHIFMCNSDSVISYVKILNFGINPLPKANHTFQTSIGKIAGNPMYLSPEQVARRLTDHRTDIYSLGLIMYRCISGVPPFVAANHSELLLKQKTQMPPPLKSPFFDIPPKLETLILRCLHKIPANRIDSVESILAQLLDVMLFESR